MPTPLPAADPAIRLHPIDNVVIAREKLSAGAVLAREQVSLVEAIPAGHKIAIHAIAAGDGVVKGGHTIGRASRAIGAGERVDAHNVAAMSGPIEVAQAAARAPTNIANPGATFDGIVRADGRVATRNYIVVAITVNCAATTARKIAEHFTSERLGAYPNVDGVVALVHELGCGMEMTGEPMDLLRRTIAGTVRHPNTAAALICSLGCERNNVYKLMEAQKLESGPRLRTLVMQERGGTQKTVEEGIAAIEAMLPLANEARREKVSAAHLVIGMQSAGADAFSELSANPALGFAADLLIANGGTAVIAGTGELAGMEKALAARAATPEVAARLERRLEWWRQYNAGHDTPVSGRLSPSSSASGFSTPLERALAASKRWGRHPLADVVEYAHPIATKGLVFMDTPAHAAIAATGQIAGGANLVCMVTGHGTGFGSLPAPTLKLASHSAVFRRMRDDLDIDCGPLLEGLVDVEEMGRRIFSAILAHASGEKTKAEDLGVGESEFVPWPIGLTA
jgi:altronate hydrolase